MKLATVVGLAVSLVAALSVAACADSGAHVETEGSVYTLYVGPELVDCVGVAPQKCMQVKRHPDDDYTMMYDPIEGFEYDEGHEYELLVEETEVANPPADASSIKLTLVEIVDKTPVATD